MQRSWHSLDAPTIPGGLTHQRLFSSTLTFWRLRIATSRPVRPPFLQRHPVTSPTVFSSSDGVETLMDDEGLPPDVDPFFELAEWDPSGGCDGDFDDPVHEDPAQPQSQGSPNASKQPQKSIKTYVVKDTAHKV